MLVVRIVGVLVAIAIGACVVLWLLTGERKWLRYAWNLFRVALALIVGFLILLFGERLLVAGMPGEKLAERAAGGRIAHPGVQAAQHFEARRGQLHTLLSFPLRDLQNRRLHPHGN